MDTEQTSEPTKMFTKCKTPGCNETLTAEIVLPDNIRVSQPYCAKCKAKHEEGAG